MASIRLEIPISASAEKVWEALRDFGNVHKRVVPGFVTDCRLEPGARVVTFANGSVARELLVDCDDAARRLCYASVGGERLAHHNSSNQVVAEGDGRCRMIWITDLLPDAMAPAIRGMMEQGAAVLSKTLANHP